jgi:anti-sigma B factor antagonist
MSIKKRAVKVHQLPEQMTTEQERRFLRELQHYSETERPRFVLDCSKLWNMDRPTISLLLSCLEQAMKCNGDVRLAGLCSEAEAALRNAGVSHLFEMFVTTESAIQSFHRRPNSMAPMTFEAETFDNVSENAA